MATMRKYLCLLAVILMLPACNTVQGVGKDIKKAGDKIEDAAK